MKRRQLLNQQSTGRWLALFIVAFMMPLALWAQQDYGITVGGVQVTSENAGNVMGDEYHSVTYDDQTKTLTLKGIELSSAVTAPDDTQLTVYLIGFSQMTGGFDDQWNNLPCFQIGGSQASVTFKTSELFPGTLDLLDCEPATCSVVYQNGLGNHENVICVPESDETRVCSFAGHVSDQGIHDFMYARGGDFYVSYVAFNQSTPVISTQTDETTAFMRPSSIDASSLKKVTFQFDWGTCTNQNVTVQVRGMRQNQDNYEYEFDGNAYSDAVSLSAADADGIVEIPLTSLVTSETLELYFSSSEAFSFVPLRIGFMDYPGYGIRVGRKSVNELNAADVLGDGKVSFDVEKNTLTLNNAVLDMSNEYATSPVESTLQNLKVILKGNTQVTIADGSDNPYVFRYVGVEETASLTLQTEADEYGNFGSLVAQGVEELENLSPGYTLTNDIHKAADELTGWEYTIESTGFTSTLTLSYKEYYDIWISGSRLNSSNRNGGFSGDIDYDDSKHTLSLGGISYSFVVTSKMSSLTIELAGENMISDVQFEATNDVPTGTLTFVVKEGTPSLKLYTTDDAQPFGGFSNVSYENKLHLTHVEGDQQNYYLVDVKVPQEPNYCFTDDPTGHSSYPNGSKVSNLNYGQENTLPWLINVPDGLAITYSTSDAATATVDQEGHITLTGAGHVWISASNQETDDYVAHTERIRLEIRPSDPQPSIEQGAYYAGQTLTLIPTVPNGEMYYKIGWSGEKVKYTEPIVLEKGKWVVSLYTLCTSDDEEMWSYGNVHPEFYVYDELTLSPESGAVSNDDIQVEVGNLPTTTEANPNEVHVYYFFGEDDGDDTNDLLYDELAKVNVSESTKVNAYIKVDGDSGYVYKTEPVEAEYTVMAKTELNISYANNSREWASYYAEEQSLETPEGLQPYIVTAAEGNALTVSAIDYIPQGVGVLLKRVTEDLPETILAKAYMGEETEITGNLLKGTAAAKAVATETGSVYVLYNDGFTRAYKGSIPAHRAYLTLGAEDGSARLMIWEGETTGVQEMEKCRNVENETFYNLNGQRVQQPAKGLYITNGKKVVIK